MAKFVGFSKNAIEMRTLLKVITDYYTKVFVCGK